MLSKKTIYLVRGNTGQYDYYYEWDVAAFSSSEDAAKRFDFLNELLGDNHSSNPKRTQVSHDHRIAAEMLIRQRAEGDPNCCIDYTGSSYAVIELDYYYYAE